MLVRRTFNQVQPAREKEMTILFWKDVKIGNTQSQYLLECIYLYLGQTYLFAYTLRWLGRGSLSMATKSLWTWKVSIAVELKVNPRRLGGWSGCLVQILSHIPMVWHDPTINPKEYPELSIDTVCPISMGLNLTIPPSAILLCMCTQVNVKNMYWIFEWTCWPAVWVSVKGEWWETSPTSQWHCLTLQWESRRYTLGKNIVNIYSNNYIHTMK